MNTQTIEEINIEKELADLILLWGDGVHPISEEYKADLEAFGLHLFIRLNNKFQSKLEEVRRETAELDIYKHPVIQAQRGLIEDLKKQIEVMEKMIIKYEQLKDLGDQALQLAENNLLNQQHDEKVEITRVEVIDSKGRSYVNWDKDNKVELSYQDEGRTLKVFIKKDQHGKESE